MEGKGGKHTPPPPVLHQPKKPGANRVKLAYRSCSGLFYAIYNIVLWTAYKRTINISLSSLIESCKGGLLYL